MSGGNMRFKVTKGSAGGPGRWLLLLIVLLLTSCVPSTLPSPQELVFKPLEGTFPQAETVTLSNGMVVYLLEDHELPLVNLYALIRTGAIYEPDNKVGLAELTGVVMRTGGTRSMSGDEINERLEFIAGEVETSIGWEEGRAGLSVLKKDVDLGLKIFAEVLMYPRFAQDKVDLAKQQKEEEIRRRNDNPQSIAFRKFRKLLFPDNPRGRVTTLKTIAAIRRKDLVAFHKHYFHPGNIILGVSGDFTRDEVIAKLEQVFSKEEGSEPILPQVPFPTAREERSVNYVERDLPQSTIVMGSLSIGKSHPDFFALEVLNFIVGGGGFNSRLMSEIRSRRGLAYSVGSVYQAEVDFGIFGAYCFTKSESTAECVGLMLKMMEEVRKEGITQEELSWAKSSITNNFIFEFSSAAQIVSRKIAFAYDKLPQEFLETYRQRIAAVTPEEVQGVAEKYLHPDRMVILVVGKGGRFDRPLSEFGKVTTLSLEEPL